MRKGVCCEVVDRCVVPGCIGHVRRPAPMFVERHAVMMLEFQQKAVRRCLEAAIQFENGLRGFVERLKHDNEENPTLKKALKDVKRQPKPSPKQRHRLV